MTPAQETVFQAQRMFLVLLLKRHNGLVRFTREELAGYHSNDEIIAFKKLDDIDGIDNIDDITAVDVFFVPFDENFRDLV